MPMLHYRRTSPEKSLGSEPSWTEVPLNTSRNQALNTSLVKSAHRRRMAGEVPSPSLHLLAREGRVNSAQDLLLLYGQGRCLSRDALP